MAPTQAWPELSAPRPVDWIAGPLRSFCNQDEYRSADDPPSVWRSAADLLHDDAAELRSRHAELTARGEPGAAATVAVLGWTAGPLAAAIGFTWAYAGAVLRCDPSATRVRFHPAGWADDVALASPDVLVAPGHAWAGQRGVTVLADERAAVSAAAAALADLTAALVEACRRLSRSGRVGRVGLWNEVLDAATSNVLAYETHRPVDPSVADRLLRLAATADSPWKARPSIRIDTASFGPVYLTQRGGCCLAYTSHQDDASSASYCATCSLRPRLECEARQLAWMEERVRSATAT